VLPGGGNALAVAVATATGACPDAEATRRHTPVGQTHGLRLWSFGGPAK
jgi:hypothetical protein